MENKNEQEVRWHERLRLLREIYAVGIQVLADAQSPRSTALPDRWGFLDDLWSQMAALDPRNFQDNPPQDPTLLQQMGEQARANEKLFKSLRIHCVQLKKQLADVLPKIKIWSDLADIPEESRLQGMRV